MSDARSAVRAVPGREVLGDGTVAVWQAPPVCGPVPVGQPGSAGGAPPGHEDAAVQAQRLAELEFEARAAGYRRGVEEGRAEGRSAVGQQAARLSALADALLPQSRLLDDRLLEQLAALVVAAIRQFVRRELSLQPGEVVRVIREAVAVLPAAESALRLHLHPDDAALVTAALQPQQLERPWRIVEDLAVTRGGVRVETDASSVDATVEARMNALLARLLGDERRTGSPAGEERAGE